MLLSLVTASAAAFSPGAQMAAASYRRSTVSMSAADAVTAWLPASRDTLVSSLELIEKEYAADLGYASFSLGGASGGISSYEAPGKNNVAWCSALSLSDGDASALGSISGFVGPLSDVPHLLASCGVSDGGIDLLIDFRPRSECGYVPSGEYEEPATREAFAMSGNRKDYAGAFYTEDAVAWRDALLALDGATHTPLSAEAMATESAGPLYTCLRLPLTDDAAAAAAKACEEATARWLGWMVGAAENKRELPAGAKQTMVYARDTKVRANNYGRLVKKYTALYGDEGKDLAAADAGPLDEAYVGGAS